MPYRRRRQHEKMDRVLLRTVHFSEQMRPKCTNLSGSNGGRRIPNPQTRSGIGHQYTKCGKAAGVDNVPAELITQCGRPMVEVLHAICRTICEMG